MAVRVGLVRICDTVLGVVARAVIAACSTWCLAGVGAEFPVGRSGKEPCVSPVGQPSDDQRPATNEGELAMKIVVTGCTSLIGSTASPFDVRAAMR